jgi:hypothetical protein
MSGEKLNFARKRNGTDRDGDEFRNFANRRNKFATNVTTDLDASHALVDIGKNGIDSEQSMVDVRNGNAFDSPEQSRGLFINNRRRYLLQKERKQLLIDLPNSSIIRRSELSDHEAQGNDSSSSTNNSSDENQINSRSPPRQPTDGISTSEMINGLLYGKQDVAFMIDMEGLKVLMAELQEAVARDFPKPDMLLRRTGDSIGLQIDLNRGDHYQRNANASDDRFPVSSPAEIVREERRESLDESLILTNKSIESSILTVLDATLQSNLGSEQNEFGTIVHSEFNEDGESKEICDADEGDMDDDALVIDQPAVVVNAGAPLVGVVLPMMIPPANDDNNDDENIVPVYFDDDAEDLDVLVNPAENVDNEIDRDEANNGEGLPRFQECRMCDRIFADQTTLYLHEKRDHGALFWTSDREYWKLSSRSSQVALSRPGLFFYGTNSMHCFPNGKRIRLLVLCANTDGHLRDKVQSINEEIAMYNGQSIEYICRFRAAKRIKTVLANVVSNIAQDQLV